MTIKTVGDLIDELEELDMRDAEIRLMEQPSWPFEYSIDGIIDSEELARRARAAGDEDELDDEQLADRHPSTGITTKPKCVFILEGRQLSYGDKDAWN